MGIEVLEHEIIRLKTYLNFREYVLNEAKQVGYIYHFTTLSNISKILSSHKIKKGNQGYVSLTRDFQLPDETGYFNTGEYIIRIVIDGDKLSNNVKLTPHSDPKFNDEREEAVINDIDTKYIKHIDFLITDNRIFPEESISVIKDSLESKYKIEMNFIKKYQPIKR